MKIDYTNGIRFLLKHVFILLCLSCKKDGQVPVVSTSGVTGIYANMASCGGEVISNGVTTLPKGICWSTESSPTIADNKTIGYSQPDIFTGSLTDLKPNTTYYVRAYATNNEGTGYGNEVHFTTMQGVTDIEGNVYNIVTIGTQRWLRENLKVTKYNDETPIIYCDFKYSSNPSPAYCWYMNAEEYKNIYGALYNWYAVNTGKLSPSGWHVATDQDWKTLLDYSGGSSIAAAKLKEVGTTHWTQDWGSTNEFDFTALPGGIFNFQFVGLGYAGMWWTATQFDDNEAFFRSMIAGDAGIGGTDIAFNKRELYSVRCVED